VTYLAESAENPRDGGHTRLTFRGIRLIAPKEFIDDTAHLGDDPSGWLLDFPESEWVEELRSTYSRDFSHSLAMLRRGEIAPAIQIDGRMGDGRGRAMLHWALGLKKMPVAIFEVIDE
jgi:hypothetical protein